MCRSDVHFFVSNVTPFRRLVDHGIVCRAYYCTSVPGTFLLKHASSKRLQVGVLELLKQGPSREIGVTVPLTMASVLPVSYAVSILTPREVSRQDVALSHDRALYSRVQKLVLLQTNIALLRMQPSKAVNAGGGDGVYSIGEMYSISCRAVVVRP